VALFIAHRLHKQVQAVIIRMIDFRVNFVPMRPTIIGFGLLILCLLILFKISEVNFIKGNVRLEVIVAIAALIFFVVGLYFNQHAQRKADRESPDSDTAVIDYNQVKKTGLTQREHEVLVKMAEGLSNQEIGQQLFLSESTVKTHVSSILYKLEAKRRAQAVQIARQLKIIS
jgi:DNA-binding CsgD family transcriptional regulator